ncbi:formyltransferase family protein [Dethiothermospora halolimnae]|uniref:formyltransferase family protein n=1 Tax=Dethiothermospora halolimnae TaxID=3114390 RepID=UPI003CCC038E
MNIIIATTKSWNINNAKKFIKNTNNKYKVYLITSKEELEYKKVKIMDPDYIFFPHWSWVIPKDIFIEFACIVFHMTDLPFGRGGSPLQNLIELGIKDTKISAIKVDGGIDTGEIYMKKDLNLNGSAEEIFMRASNIIFDNMINEIINNKIIPKKQEGEVVKFKRRTSRQSEIKKDFDLNKIYDYIRMLDCKGYPKAYIDFGDYRLEFSRASLKEGKIVADVEIRVQ